MALGCLRSEKNAAPPLEPAATPTAPIGTLEVRLRRDRLDLEYIARRFRTPELLGFAESISTEVMAKRV